MHRKSSLREMQILRQKLHGEQEGKKSDNPTVQLRKFQESWKDTFPWVVHGANQDVMYCSICRRYPAFANLHCSFYIGCGSGGEYHID